MAVGQRQDEVIAIERPHEPSSQAENGVGRDFSFVEIRPDPNCRICDPVIRYHDRVALKAARIVALGAGLALLPQSAPSAQTATTDKRVVEAFNKAYDLDHDEAMSALEAVMRDDPSHPAPPRALATVTWLNLLFRRGVVLVENYLGPVSREDVKTKAPPSKDAAAYQGYITKALALAETRLAKAPNDPAALYEYGTAVGLQASWSATIDGKVLGAFGSARRAYNAHERVLALAPTRKDAGLIVGTYRYLVGSLVLPARWIAYMAGFGGDKERGLRLIEEAARYPGMAQTDAKFALVLLFNREERYDRALAYLAELQHDFPRNRLLWLETGATYLRARRAAEAEVALNEGIRKLEQDRRPRMLGEEGQWYYKRGAARVVLRRPAEATADLNLALAREMPAWVRGRTHLELGKAADLAGNRQAASAAYDRCLQLCAAAQDDEAVSVARRLKSAAYR
jgi:tetratricopeptide (TPR) repeat protein